MNVALRRPMNVEEFLAWEARQALRYEFDGLQPLAMVGGTAAHSVIQANLIASLVTRLQGTRCQAHGSHMKLRLNGRIRYPDAFVVCTPVAAGATWIAEPVVVFEILSPATAHADLVTKNAEYQAAPSVLRYVVLEQTGSPNPSAARGRCSACRKSASQSRSPNYLPGSRCRRRRTAPRPARPAALRQAAHDGSLRACRGRQSDGVWSGGGVRRRPGLWWRLVVLFFAFRRKEAVLF